MKNKVLTSLKSSVKISIMDIAVSGFLVAMVLILAVFTKYTAFRILNLNFEYLTYIIFGFFLGWFKGAILAFIADTLTLVIAGHIGFWMWEFGIIAPLIAMVSAAYFYFIKNYKIFNYIAPNIIVFLTFVFAVVVIWTQINNAKNDQVTISRIFGFTKISTIAISIMAAVFAGLVIALGILWIIYFKSKSEKQKKAVLLTINTFAIIVLIIVIFRWLIHPIAYINYLNYASQNKAGYVIKTYGDWYYVWLARNVLKSILTIPLYTLLLIILIHPFEYLKNRYLIEPLAYQY
ncbi:ECF transporter S component [Mycoplasmopsis alligatoris]|uniref:ECF transporter S component n=1 Tax=Mycoplasmopsis alligatoris A21JP2 TaxID=747682 RepID=D4XW15_9BACT|nr:ECF transporter S component [Mycoplasmopsis alligatoris]EFF41467.1 conserved hypothetical protein [Mycoplasmopsis alligatoris A21JP2]